MSYHSILAPIAFEETARSVTDAALVIARAFQGHVLGHHIRQRFEYYPPVAFYPLVAEFPAAAADAQTEAASAFARSLRSTFEERCDAANAHIVPIAEALKQNGVTASWTDEIGALPAGYGRYARIADLSIVAFPPAKDGHLETNAFEGLLMDSGAPVLLIPRSGLAAAPKRPLIAWDGSLPAARAMRAARPFISDAGQATVLTIGHEDLGTPGVESAASWLERAGALAEDRTIEWPKGPVAELILNQAEACNCDLIVMGGYSHSRLHETLLGGATRHILAHADRPILMMH